jgi:uncharacterized protein
MTIELRPMGVACNLGCTYCYQEPMREAGNINTKYDISKMFEQVEKVNQSFNLFGGEALLIPKKDLETMFAYGFKKFGRSGIQTNGTLIDDDHIRIFKKYNVSVGISCDGPGELNGLRVVRKNPNDEDLTNQFTSKTIQAIVKLIQNNIVPGIIVTLHKKNGTKEALPKLIEFIDWLSTMGVNGGNIHVLEIDKTMPDQDKHVLSQEENIEAFLTLAEYFNKNKHLSWLPFRDMPNMLRGDDDSATCYWKNCDHMDTKAVYGIEGDGSLSNCGRTNKEGIDWYKADTSNYARYISLYNSPDEIGGCQGCRFWITCGGSCVGEATNGDFRNKTVHCQTMKKLQTFYEDELEKEGITPITKSPLLKDIEKIIYNGFVENKPVPIKSALRYISEKSKNLGMVSVVVKSSEKTTIPVKGGAV